MLRRIVIERTRTGWQLVREMEETSDRWQVDDLLEAFEIVSKGFRPDGTLRTLIAKRVTPPTSEAK